MNNNRRNGARRARRQTNRGSYVQPRTQSAVLATSTEARTTKPIITEVPNGERIRHSELLGDVLLPEDSVSFNVEKYVINPGMDTFQWLQERAKGWEQHRFRSITFEYMNRIGGLSAGSVVMAPDYNVEQPPPTTEKQMASYEGCVEDVVWRGMICRTNMKAAYSLGPTKFVRGQAVAGTLQTYDAFNLFVATKGVQLDKVPPPGEGIGKLWVHYDVELTVPQTADLQGATRVTWATTTGGPQNNEQALQSTIPTPGASGILVEYRMLDNPLGIRLEQDDVDPLMENPFELALRTKKRPERMSRDNWDLAVAKLKSRADQWRPRERKHAIKAPLPGAEGQRFFVPKGTYRIVSNLSLTLDPSDELSMYTLRLRLSRWSKTADGSEYESRTIALAGINTGDEDVDGITTNASFALSAIDTAGDGDYYTCNLVQQQASVYFGGTVVWYVNECSVPTNSNQISFEVV